MKILEINRLGAQGDGIAETPEGQIFVPFSLPGEMFRTDFSGEFERVPETTSSDRIEPACMHFGVCGGCALQHVNAEVYLDFKRRKISEALSTRGIETNVDAVVACAPAARRRVLFSARMTADWPLLGFYRAKSGTIVAIAECPVASPEIIERLDTLRKLVELIGATPAAYHLQVTETLNGLDLSITGLSKASDGLRRSLADFAARNRLARISIDDEVILAPQDAIIRFGDVDVIPPPGGFLQAVADIEQAMALTVITYLARSKKVADLFSGSGTFTLRLAKNADVHAVENDQPALNALDRGFRFGQAMHRVTTECRDLFRRPMTTRELNEFDAVVFDPPRAGAEAQARQIARSKVTTVVAVSCNPATLARDLRILIDGGYKLESVTPYDQFLWSPHVEAVALLSKKPDRRRRR